MDRRFLVRGVLTGALLGGFWVSSWTSQPVTALQKQSQTPASINVADLQEQLKDRLKARKAGELAFINRVVQLVAINRLPISMVKGTMRWAIEAAGTRNHPFPYFQRAITLRAKALGIRL